MKHLDVAVAIVFRDSKVLITRRKQGRVLGGYWEFPGGKVELNESLQDTVRRELLEELGIGVSPVVSFAPVQHQYPDRVVTLHAFLCTHEAGEPQLIDCDEFRWVAPSDLRAYQFPEANLVLLDQVIAAFPSTHKPLELTIPKRTSRHRPTPAV